MLPALATAASHARLLTRLRAAPDATRVRALRQERFSNTTTTAPMDDSVAVPWTEDVFVAALQACGRDRDLERRAAALLEVRGWMAEEGVPATTVLYQALFHVYADPRTQSSEAVSALFDQVLQAEQAGEPGVYWNARLWGAILQAFAAAKDDESALQVLRLMNDVGFQANSRHCTTFIRALALVHKDALAVQFLNHMVGAPATRMDLFEGLATDPPDQMAVAAVLAACAAADNYVLAKVVLEGIKAGDFGPAIVPTEQDYNLVLSACKDPKEARALVREMRNTRRHRTGVVAPTLKTYTKAIAVCRRAGDLPMALRLLEGAKDDGFDLDVYVYTAVIWTAAKVGDALLAQSILDEMKREGCQPNTVSYNGLLAAYAKAGETEELLTSFAETRAHARSSRTTFHILAKHAKNMTDPSQKLQCLQRIHALMAKEDRQVDHGGQILESLIISYAAVGHFDAAKRVFDSIEGSSDAANLRAMLLACSTSSPPEWEHALELLHSSDIFLQSLPPAHVDSVALAYAMLACSKANQWEESLNLLRLYGSSDSSVVPFNSLIAACGRCSRPDVAIEVLNEMESHNVAPDELSYRNAVIACNQAEHARAREERDSLTTGENEERKRTQMFEWWECALSLLRRMKESGLDPDIQTYSSVISACEAAGEWQRALGLLQSLQDQNKELNLYCYNAGISACATGGAWIEALELYECMKERGGPLRPNSVTISGIVQALDNAGQKEMAQSIYVEAAQKGVVKPWKISKNSQGDPLRLMDLHQFSAALARAAVRSHLERLLAKPPTRIEDLVIVVGKGLHSLEKPVLDKAVSSVLTEEFDLTPYVDEANRGRIVVHKEALQKLVALRGWS
jgi:pentatricopeptide repeat protein